MFKVKRWMKKVFCTIAISIILSSGILGCYYQPASIEVQASEVITAWTLEQLLGALVSMGVSSEALDKAGIDFGDVKDYMINYFLSSTYGISTDRLRELTARIYTTNKNILRNLGYTSAEDLFRYFAQNNVTTLGQYLGALRNLADNEVGFNVGISFEMLKVLYRGLQECIQALSEKQIEIGEDGSVAVVQSSSDIDYTGFNPHCARIDSVTYHHRYYTDDFFNDIFVTSYTPDISKMFVTHIEGEDFGNFVAISNSPNQSVTVSFSTIDLYSRELLSSSKVYKLELVPGTNDVYAFVAGFAEFSSSNVYVSNVKHVPGGYTIFNEYTGGNIYDFIENHLEIFSLEDAKITILKPKTDDELRDLDGTVITPGVDIPIDKPVIDDPDAPDIDDPALPDIINPTFIGSWFGKLVAWLETVWKSIKSGNNWLSRIYDAASNTYTVQSAVLRAIKALDFEDVKRVWVHDFPDFMDELKAAVLDIPGTLKGIGDDVIGLPNVLERGWQGIKDKLEDIKDYLKNVYIDVNNLPNILETIRDLILSIPDVLASIRTAVLDIPKGFEKIKLKIGEITDWIGAFEMPKIIDYTNPLERIIELLESWVNFFVLDQFIIIQAVQSLINVASGKFQMFSFLPSFFERFHFTNSYTYPCIKMGVPDLLVKFLGTEIILIDFGKYKTILLTVRTLIKALFWFMFAHHIIKMVTPKFRIS